MATIRQRKNKGGEVVYEVQVRMAGHPRRSGTFRKMADAKRWASRTEAEIREARYFGNRPTSGATLSEAIDRFLKERLSDYNKHDQVARVRLLNWWRDRIGSIRLTHIRTEHVSSAVVDLQRDGYSNSTINHYIAAISRVLSIAVKEWQMAATNPARNVTRRPMKNGRVRFLSHEERASLMRACEESRSEILAPLVTLALCTGARRGELMALAWDDVSLERKTATFRDTKNKSDRTIPLSKPAIDALMALPRDGRKVFGRWAFPREAWVFAVKRSGVANFRFHDLRHTAASYLAMCGATQIELAEMLGHKTLIMVKRYAHFSESHLSGLAAKMADKFITRPSQGDPATTD